MFMYRRLLRQQTMHATQVPFAWFNELRRLKQDIGLYALCFFCISGPTSYLEAAGAGTENNSPAVVIHEGEDSSIKIPAHGKDVICPFASHGACRFGDSCSYLHGEICDTCDRPVLHPTDEEQRIKHAKVMSMFSCIIVSSVCHNCFPK